MKVVDLKVIVLGDRVVTRYTGQVGIVIAINLPSFKVEFPSGATAWYSYDNLLLLND